VKPGIGLGLFLIGLFLAPPMGLTPATAGWFVVSAVIAATGAVVLKGALFGEGAA
jgi:hypothetical protein